MIKIWQQRTPGSRRLQIFTNICYAILAQVHKTLKEVVPFVQVLNLLVCTRICEFGSVSELFLTCVSPLSHNFYSLRSSLRASLPRATYRPPQLSSITTTSQGPWNRIFSILFRFTSSRPIFGQNLELRFYSDWSIVNMRPGEWKCNEDHDNSFNMTKTRNWQQSRNLFCLLVIKKIEKSWFDLNPFTKWTRNFVFYTLKERGLTSSHYPFSFVHLFHSNPRRVKNGCLGNLYTERVLSGFEGQNFVEDHRIARLHNSLSTFSQYSGSIYSSDSQNNSPLNPERSISRSEDSHF